MRTFYAVVLMVGLAGCAWGQQVPRWAANLPVVSTEGGIDDGHTKPLKCGKWEHVEYESCPSSQQVCTMSAFPSCSCSVPQKSACVPDMHEVTEKDWQELLARLKALENKR